MMIWVLLSKDLGTLLYLKNNCVLFVYILLTQLGPLINKLNINITIIVEIESNFSISLRKKLDLKFVIRKTCGTLLLKIMSLDHVMLYSSKK